VTPGLNAQKKVPEIIIGKEIDNKSEESGEPFKSLDDNSEAIFSENDSTRALFKKVNKV
jgi:hypothetical protein